MIYLIEKVKLKDIQKQGAEFLFSNEKYSFYELDNLKSIVGKNDIFRYSFYVDDKDLRKYEIMDTPS